MKPIAVALLLLSNVAAADAFLACDFGEQKDFISLTDEKTGKDGAYYSRATYQRSYGDQSKLKFDDSPKCTMHCVGVGHYRIFRYLTLDRKTLGLTDTLPNVNGRPERVAQCETLDRETWDAEIQLAKSANGNKL